MSVQLQSFGLNNTDFVTMFTRQKMRYKIILSAIRTDNVDQGRTFL